MFIQISFLENVLMSEFTSSCLETFVQRPPSATNINETLGTRIGKIIYNVSCGINKKVVKNIDINSTI